MNLVPNSKILVAYVPTPHSGYIQLFKKYEQHTLYVLGDDLIADFLPLVRNLPANTPSDVQKMIVALGIFPEVHILKREDLPIIRQSKEIVMPDEDVSRSLAENYFTESDIIFDASWKLRWDKNATLVSRRPEGERVVSVETLDREIMDVAYDAACRSSDWWRQVGAALVRDGKVLLVRFNKHLPSEQSAYLEGDPRSNFGPGESIDASLAAHAEASIFAIAACRGICTKGCDLYVTTFPCPPCATSVALGGIRRLYYVEGYSLVAGAETIESAGTQIIRVEM